MTTDRDTAAAGRAGTRDAGRLAGFPPGHARGQVRRADRSQLRQRAVPPASLSLLGLVRHMAEGEHQWFTLVLGGEQAPWPYYTDDQPGRRLRRRGRRRRGRGVPTWRAACASARARVAAAPSLDVTGRQDGREFSLRWIMVHMIEEYARHNGHADLLRQRIDGATGV